LLPNTVRRLLVSVTMFTLSLMVGLIALPQEGEAGPLRRIGKAATAPVRFIFRGRSCSRNDAYGVSGGSDCPGGQCPY
jgi:hypothetical protein